MLAKTFELLFETFILITICSLAHSSIKIEADNNIFKARDIDAQHPVNFNRTTILNSQYNSEQTKPQDTQHRTRRLTINQEDDTIYNHQDTSQNHPYDGVEYNSYSRGNKNKLLDQRPPSDETLLSEPNTANEIDFGGEILDHISDVDIHNNNHVDKVPLNRRLISRLCQLDRGSQRSAELNNTYLMYCFRYKLENLLSNEILMSIMHHDSRDCEKILGEFVQLDETINQFDNLFTKLLSRYNCHNGYSVKWNCDDCKKAYKDWLCSTHLPFYMNGERIKPCISFCERVEQRCPYLHPITREQYGGQPVFICRDPNIPFVPTITPDIPYSESGKCYDICHLSDNLTELLIDSLSKYDYDKCPDKAVIAGEVRHELVSTTVNGNQQPPILDSGDYPDSFMDENGELAMNHTKVRPNGRKTTHVHNKKLEELREVLANYKNQAKTHRYHADHSSIDHSKPQIETLSS